MTGLSEYRSFLRSYQFISGEPGLVASLTSGANTSRVARRWDFAENTANVVIRRAIQKQTSLGAEFLSGCLLSAAIFERHRILVEICKDSTGAPAGLSTTTL